MREANILVREVSKLSAGAITFRGPVGPLNYSSTELVKKTDPLIVGCFVTSYQECLLALFAIYFWRKISGENFLRTKWQLRYCIFGA